MKRCFDSTSSLLGMVMKKEFNPLYLKENMYICMPDETEAGSAGEQPVRDKSGARRRISD